MAKKKKGRTVDVDLSDVESGGLVPEGAVVATVKEVTQEEGADSGAPYLAWKFKTDHGTLFHNTSLQKQALFNLRNLLEALNVEIPDTAMQLDLDEMEGLSCIAEVSHEEHKGKTRARCAGFMKLEEPSSGDDDDDEDEVKVDKSKPGKRGLAKIDSDAFDDMDEEELEELVETYGLSVEIEGKSLKKKRALIRSALEDEGLIED